MNMVTLNADEQKLISDKTILLVEDNSNDALITQRSLKKANVMNTVDWVKDGEEALDYIFGQCLEKGKNLPQLILLDIHMPKVNGIEVLKKIRGDERTMWLPVVIFTSSTEEKDLVESYRLGINSYICKPIELDKFLPVVATIGCYWILMNHPL
jgi:two-component system response regulator